MQPLPPEARARQRIDAALTEAGWVVQSRHEINLAAGRGVAIREFLMAPGFGEAGYLLYVDGQPVGALEAKKEGHTLSGVERQAKQYSEGLPANLNAPHRPLPFLYLSNAEETLFTNLFDPKPRSRAIFRLHRPETLAEWLKADTLKTWLADRVAEPMPGWDKRPSTLRTRLQRMPPVELPNLWPNQVEAVKNLELSLAQDHPRALVQMATGSGKTILAVTALYRLIKFGGARPVLFLVDRKNLGIQAEKEFANCRSPDDNRKFTELYNVQRLTSTTVGASTKVAITTIQRLYAILNARDKVSLDLFWLRDESLEDSANLPEPHLLAEEIAEDLRDALEQIESVLTDLRARVPRGS